MYRHMFQVWNRSDIKTLCEAVSQLNSALDLLQKYKNNSIPREINMLREGAQNTIGSIKDTPTKRKRKLRGTKGKYLKTKEVWGKEITNTEYNTVSKLT